MTLTHRSWEGACHSSYIFCSFCLFVFPLVTHVHSLHMSVFLYQYLKTHTFGIKFKVYNHIKLKNWSSLGMDLITYLPWLFIWGSKNEGMIFWAQHRQRKTRFIIFPQLSHFSSFQKLFKACSFFLVCKLQFILNDVLC